MNLAEKDRLARQLAAVIDTDEPPGLAASTLATTVIELVRDRDTPDALLLANWLNELATRFPRKR